MILGKDGSIFDDRRKKDRRAEGNNNRVENDKRKEDRRKVTQKTTHIQ